MRTIRVEDADDVESVVRSLELVSKAMLKLGLYFFWYMYEHVPVYYEREGRAEGSTDGVSIFVAREFTEKELQRQLFVILHELLHMAYRHPQMLQGKLVSAKSTLERNIITIAYNVIMDAVVNKQLYDLLSAKGVSASFIKDHYVNPDIVCKVLDDDVVKLGFSLGFDRLMYLINTGAVEVRAVAPDGRPIDLSAVEVGKLRSRYSNLHVTFTNTKTGGTFKVNLVLDVSRSPSGGGGGEGDEEEGGEGEGESEEGPEKGVGEGRGTPSEDSYTKVGGRERDEKPILVKRPLSGTKPKQDEIENLVRRAMDFDIAKRALDEEKHAGAGAYMSAIFELFDVESKKPRWLDKLRLFVDDYLGMFKVYTWQKVHKRAPFIKPGYYAIDTPHVIIMLDTSGSMLGKDLERALSEIIGLVESFPDARVTLYQWSSTCSLPERVDRYFVTRVKTHRKLPILTGGTELKPALDTVLPTVTNKDFVVIMTDGYIYDVGTEEVQKKLSELAKRSARTLFITTGAVPKLPNNIEVIKIE